MLEKIVLSGSPKERGIQYGESLKPEIHEVLNIYKPIWNLSEENIRERVQGFKSMTWMFFPHLAEEILGIAEGSGLHEDLIYAINARTELLPNNLDCLVECTSIGVQKNIEKDGNVLLAQNWDWLNTLRGLTKIIEISSSPKIMTLIEPGMIGMIGMNEYQIGLCLNYIHSERISKAGIPIRVLCRAVLEQTSVEEASALLKRVPHAANMNYFVGDQQNNLSCIEACPPQVKTSKKKGIITHTNVFLGNYCPRQKRTDELLASALRNLGKLSTESIKGTLRSVEFPLARQGEIETVHTIVMDLAKKELSISEGAKCREFETYTFT